MSQEEYLEYKGLVIELKRSHYLIKILYKNNDEKDKQRYIQEKTENIEKKANYVQCVISGKMSKNRVKVIVGDYVRILIHITDVTKGRILYRDKTDV